ncbi:unnamed protein product [Vitrella brassicaformis CCMP3155]|uniref:Importin subunit alpha n=1 Tax=Vitrella brassicaformis (strain CCMP3155) TaxID=1169540 RepID=A0A0G4EJB0_VITBC|nr:unnamed protein product [Vitrella brassicaformis CCMP3155]|eukprot:CEL96814.1 unnamed protein product [Vitrella brassicaformis CCMP3155]
MHSTSPLASLRPARGEVLERARELFDLIKTREAYDNAVQQRGAEALEAKICATVTDICRLVSSRVSSAGGRAGIRFSGLHQLAQLIALPWPRNGSIAKKAVNADGVLPVLMTLMADSSHTSNHQIQREAVRVLGNISWRPEHADAVVGAGAIPPLVQLVSSPHDDLREMAMQVLDRLADASPVARDSVLEGGVMEPLLTVVRSTTTTAVLRSGVSLVFALCGGESAIFGEGTPPAVALVSECLPVLAEVVGAPGQDEDVLSSAVFALQCLSEGGYHHADAVVVSGVCGRMVELATQSTVRDPIRVTVMRFLANTAAGPDDHRGALIECGVIPMIKTVLQAYPEGGTWQYEIAEMACWTVSTICAGTVAHIQAVLDEGIVPLLVNILSDGGSHEDSMHWRVRFVAANAIERAADEGSQQQVQYVIECGCIQPLCDMLHRVSAISAINSILWAGLRKQQAEGLATNPYSTLVEQAGGVTKLVELQRNDNHNTSMASMEVLFHHFPHRVDMQQGVDDESDGLADLDTDVGLDGEEDREERGEEEGG